MVGILGAWGPAAGADFVRLFVQACTECMVALGIPVLDQFTPNIGWRRCPCPTALPRWNDPREGAHQPLDSMLQATGRPAALGVRVVAIACNTAHAACQGAGALSPYAGAAWRARSGSHTRCRPGLARRLAGHARHLQHRPLPARAGAGGIACCVPEPAEQDLLMWGIYEGVKAGDMALARNCFEQVARALEQRHGVSALIMGCTEIPLIMLSCARTPGVRLVNPTQVLSAALARHAYGAMADATLLLRLRAACGVLSAARSTQPVERPGVLWLSLISLFGPHFVGDASRAAAECLDCVFHPSLSGSHR